MILNVVHRGIYLGGGLIFRNIYGRLFFLTLLYCDEDAGDDKAYSYGKSHTIGSVLAENAQESCDECIDFWQGSGGSCVKGEFELNVPVILAFP